MSILLHVLVLFQFIGMIMAQYTGFTKITQNNGDVELAESVAFGSVSTISACYNLCRSSDGNAFSFNSASNQCFVSYSPVLTMALGKCGKGTCQAYVRASVGSAPSTEAGMGRSLLPDNSLSTPSGMTKCKNGFCATACNGQGLCSRPNSPYQCRNGPCWSACDTASNYCYDLMLSYMCSDGPCQIPCGNDGKCRRVTAAPNTPAPSGRSTNATAPAPNTIVARPSPVPAPPTIPPAATGRSANVTGPAPVPPTAPLAAANASGPALNAGGSQPSQSQAANGRTIPSNMVVLNGL
ncbi:hypothetical protein MP638_006059 [Amoeboaphelidium occidentale]|nr:hypothetical protein MP638_006059 [Amoeboaphelidium occidentale]